MIKKELREALEREAVEIEYSEDGEWLDITKPPMLRVLIRPDERKEILAHIDAEAQRVEFWQRQNSLAMQACDNIEKRRQRLEDTINKLRAIVLHEIAANNDGAHTKFTLRLIEEMDPFYENGF